MRLLIDMDSVLVEMMSSWFELYCRDYDHQLHLSSITDWDVSRFVRPECGKKIFDYLHQPGFFLDLPPMPDGPDVLAALHDQGHEIFIVTSPPPHSRHAVWEKTQWVKQHLPFFDLHHLIFTQHKFLIHGDLLFDDNPTHLQRFPRTTVAFAYPYNLGLGHHRVSSWREFHDLFRLLFPS